MKWARYVDAEGQWFCPIDTKTGKLYNSMRVDADNFLMMFEEDTIFEVHEPLAKLPLVVARCETVREPYADKVAREKEIEESREG